MSRQLDFAPLGVEGRSHQGRPAGGSDAIREKHCHVISISIRPYRASAEYPCHSKAHKALFHPAITAWPGGPHSWNSPWNSSAWPLWRLSRAPHLALKLWLPGSAQSIPAHSSWGSAQGKTFLPICRRQGSRPPSRPLESPPPASPAARCRRDAAIGIRATPPP